MSFTFGLGRQAGSVRQRAPSTLNFRWKGLFLHSDSENCMHWSCPAPLLISICSFYLYSNPMLPDTSRWISWSPQGAQQQFLSLGRSEDVKSKTSLKSFLECAAFAPGLSKELKTVIWPPPTNATSMLISVQWALTTVLPTVSGHGLRVGGCTEGPISLFICQPETFCWVHQHS